MSKQNTSISTVPVSERTKSIFITFFHTFTSFRGLKNKALGQSQCSNAERVASRRPLLEATDLPRSRSSSESPYSDSTSDLESQTTVTDLREEKDRVGPKFRFDKKQMIKDATIGLSDGLTVPFALTAGLSALGKTNIVVYGGLAELIAGAISMGLGGYMAEKIAITFYNHEQAQVEELVAKNPQAAGDEIVEAMEPFNFPQALLQQQVDHLTSSPEDMVAYIMKCVRCESKPDSRQAGITSATIGFSYLVGGLLPLLPYMFVGQEDVYLGLQISVVVMVVALFIFGYLRICTVIGSWSCQRTIKTGCWEGIKMVLVGSVAAAAAMAFVKVGDDLMA